MSDYECETVTIEPTTNYRTARDSKDREALTEPETCISLYFFYRPAYIATPKKRRNPIRWLRSARKHRRSKPAHTISRVKRTRRPTREQMYRQIGKRGLTRDDHERQQKYWGNSAEESARWLILRIGTEKDSDVLRSVANLLADLGNSSIAPIIAHLQRKPATDVSVTLLEALQWISPPKVPNNLRDSLAYQIHRNLRDLDSEVREAAASAALILGPDEAKAMLKEAIRTEHDENVREVMDDVIGQCQIP